MNEGRTNRNWIMFTLVAAVVAAFVIFAAFPQGRKMIRQALYNAGLIYADPMTGLD